MARKSKGNNGYAKAGNRKEKIAARVIEDGASSHQHSGYDRAHRRSGAQYSQGFGTGVQNFLYKRRQDGYGATKKYGKHIQRHDAQNQFMAPDVLQPL